MSNTTPSITPKTEQREPVDDGGPAFPTLEVPHGLDTPSPGMSLRDYFAAKAMNGSMARGGPVWGTEQERRVAYDKFAERMYAMADAMLRARKSGGAA